MYIIFFMCCAMCNPQKNDCGWFAVKSRASERERESTYRWVLRTQHTPTLFVSYFYILKYDDMCAWHACRLSDWEFPFTAEKKANESAIFSLLSAILFMHVSLSRTTEYIVIHLIFTLAYYYHFASNVCATNKIRLNCDSSVCAHHHNGYHNIRMATSILWS